eukprot:scaffold2751_cov131-Cylindrotheca_fusiformis.AAC.16
MNQNIEMNGTLEGEMAGEDGSSRTVLDSNHQEKSSSDEGRYALLRNHRIRFEDAIAPDAERVLKISKRDILFGRGKGFQNHPGNQRMRKVIEKYKTQYHALRRSDKQKLIDAVFEELIEGGARFLKKLDDEEVWVMVDRPVALQKVSHTLRCRKSEKFVGDKPTAIGKISGMDPTQVHNVLPNPSSMAPAGAYSSLMGMNLQQMSPYDSLVGLEAHRMATLERLRAISSLSTMGSPLMAMQPSFDHLGLRREQLIRDYAYMQQLQQTMPGTGLSHGFSADSESVSAPKVKPIPTD